MTSKKIKFWLKCHKCGDSAEIGGTPRVAHKIRDLWEQGHAECECTHAPYYSPDLSDLPRGHFYQAKAKCRYCGEHFILQGHVPTVCTETGGDDE